MTAIRPSKKSRAPTMTIIQPANPIHPAHAPDRVLAVVADVATSGSFLSPAAVVVRPGGASSFAPGDRGKEGPERATRSCGRWRVAARPGMGSGPDPIVPRPPARRHDRNGSSARSAAAAVFASALEQPDSQVGAEHVAPLRLGLGDRPVPNGDD